MLLNTSIYSFQFGNPKTLKKCLIGLPIVAFPFQYFSYLSKKEIGLPAVVYLMHW